MKTITFEPMLALFGLGGGEIVLIIAALFLSTLVIGGIIFFALKLLNVLKKPNPTVSPTPPPPIEKTKRVCPQCGKEMAPDAPQGLCPACLMKVGLGSQFGDATEAAKGPMPAMPSAEIGKFFPQLEIIELLGQGGMGMVYKARQPALDRMVALKILSPELSKDPAFAERFSREAKALAKLNHPNIVGVYDFGHAGDFYFFLMEYVDGMNLWQLEQSKKHLTPEEAFAIVPKICDALQYAHDEGVVHRDIKPGNILVDKKGRVKIADFGLAKIVGNAQENFPITQSRMTMGTPHYMAPEQIEKPLDVDHRADIYSLGVVFYEMLTGELPIGRFAAPSQKIKVDVRLDEVVLRTLEKEPERRYQKASEVKTQVENIANNPHTARSSTPPQAASQLRGWEYKSSKTVFGIPLLHVTSGFDPKTGRSFISRGFFAFGPIAKGIFAFGGRAQGVFAFGGIALGLVAIGGVAAGVVAGGGLTFGLLLALGGFGIGALTPAHMGLAFHAIHDKKAVVALLLLFGATLTTSIIATVSAMLWAKGHATKHFNPVQITKKADHFWRWFAVTVLALITMPFLIAILALAGAIVIPSISKKLQQRIDPTHEQILPPAGKLKTVLEYDAQKLASETQYNRKFIAAGQVDGRRALTIHNPDTGQQQILILRTIKPALTTSNYALIGRIKYENVQGEGYLELWSIFPPTKPKTPFSRFFSRTLGQAATDPMQKIKGTSDWREFVLPFFADSQFPAPHELEANLIAPPGAVIHLSDLKLVEWGGRRQVSLTDEEIIQNLGGTRTAIKDLTAEKILEITREKYKSLATFGAEAVETTEMTYDGDPTPHYIYKSCSVQMMRPHYLRCALSDSKSPENVKYMVWCNDDGAFQTGYFSVEKLKNNQPTEIQNAQYALDWKQPKPLVTELFFDTPHSWLSRLTSLSREPDDNVEGEDCFVISGNFNSRKITVWIRKQDFLLKQRREESAPRNANNSPVPPATAKNVSTNAIRSLRLNPNPTNPGLAPPPAPQPPSPGTPTSPGFRSIPERTLKLPGVGIIQPSVTPPPVAMPTFTTISTQVFRKIAVNEALINETFSHEAILEVAKRNSPQIRRNLAQALMLSGKKEQALEEFMWCWDHGREYDDFSSDRTIWMLPEIVKFGRTYPPALAALKGRRDAIENKVENGSEEPEDLDDFAVLNNNLGESARLVALFDRVPADSSARKKLFGHVFGLLLEARRYDDLLALCNPEAAVEQGIQSRKQQLDFRTRYPNSASQSANDVLRKQSVEGWARYFEVLAGAKETERAKRLSDKILEFDSGADLKERLNTAAQRSGNQEVIDYLHAVNAKNENNP